jgi:ADP-heptose:LPS heptosyltransferase
MKTTYYNDKWLDIKSQPADPAQLNRLASQIAYAFMDAYLKDCRYQENYIELLCEMTTFWEDPQLNRIAARALFSIIIESLCDDFEELQTETYNRVMTQVISFCRKLPAAEQFDHYLRNFELNSAGDLLKRIRSIRTMDKRTLNGKRIKNILLLSRVTIGADVAVTSIIIQRLGRLFPEARIVLIGGSKLKAIYGDNPGVQIKAADYNRDGGLLERLSSWQQVLNIVIDELSTAGREETILVDPDSRLSQLGVLPLISTDRYYFFDSRSNASFNRRMSMAQLTNAWLDQVTGTSDFCYPRIWLNPALIQQASRRCTALKNQGARRIITVNFGVGGNPRKALGEDFEIQLLNTLLQKPGTLILLDQGFGEAERRHTAALMQAVEKTGKTVDSISFNSGRDVDTSDGLIGVKTQIGEIAALISQSDEYIGYDSAGQHIAAAVGTPCLTIFAGSNNMRFIRRWSAFGPQRCQIVHVDTLSDPGAIQIDDIIIRIMNQRNDQD